MEGRPRADSPAAAPAGRMPHHADDTHPDDEEVVDAVRQKLQAAVATEHNYKSILAFLAFTAAYMALLWLQASAYRTSAVVATLRSLLLPGGATSTQFSSGDEVLDWIGGQLVTPFWRDPVCGDGACEPPQEFPAFGRFGCKADCGVQENTTRLLIKVRSNFAGHPLLAPRLLQAAARWNLCLLDAARRQRGDPDLCWFEQDQGFSEVAATRLETVDVIDGSWYISVQGDYAGRVQGAIYGLANASQPQQLALQPEWVGCKMPRPGQLMSASAVAAAQAFAAGMDSQHSGSSGQHISSSGSSSEAGGKDGSRKGS